MAVKMNREQKRSAFSLLSSMIIVCVLFLETISVGRMVLDESKLWMGVDESKLWGGVHESKHQGPWSECLSMTAMDCIKYIEESTAELQSPHKIQIVGPGDTESLDLDPRRVRIRVDENNTVVEIPERG
jgi:Potato inhibitor I family